MLKIEKNIEGFITYYNLIEYDDNKTYIVASFIYKKDAELFKSIKNKRSK